MSQAGRVVIVMQVARATTRCCVTAVGRLGRLNLRSMSMLYVMEMAMAGGPAAAVVGASMSRPVCVLDTVTPAGGRREPWACNVNRVTGRVVMFDDDAMPRSLCVESVKSTVRD